MVCISSDKLFRTLHEVRQRPGLLTGKNSLIAIENYINGYVDACRDLDKNSFTVRWVGAFYDYVAQVCGVKDAFFSLSHAVEEMGYDDTTGAEFLMDLLERFAKSYENLWDPELSSKEVRRGEIRVFRLDKEMAMSLTGTYIQEHREDLFGVPSDTEGYTCVSLWDKEQGVTCALCPDTESVVRISQEGTEVANQIKNLPVYSAGEKIRYSTICIE